MNRLAVSIFALLIPAAAIAPATARAQAVQPVASLSSASTSAPLQVAAVETPAWSRSSAPDLFATTGQNTTSNTSPVVNQPEGSTRPFSSLGIGVKVGTTGIGFDLATPLIPGRLNIRGGATFFSYSTTVTTDNINIDGSLKFRNAEAVIDFFPFAGWFRMSGGMTIYNDTALSANLTVPAGQSFTLGDTKYYSEAGDPINGTGTFNIGGKTAGRVSIGTGNMLPKKGHFRFESEIGVEFISSPTVAFSIAGTGCEGYNGVTYTNCGPVAPSDVQAEQTKLENDLKDLKYYPTLSFGFSYKLP